MLRLDLGRFLVAFAAVLLTLLSVTAFGQSQSKDQQKCINKLNKDGAKVVAAQGRENAGCVKDAGRGSLGGSVDACLSADRKGKPVCVSVGIGLSVAVALGFAIVRARG